MDHIDHLTLLRMSLTDCLNCGADSLLRLLEHLPERQMIHGSADLVSILIGSAHLDTGEYVADDEWAALQDIWNAVAPHVDPQVTIREDEVEVYDLVSHQSISIPIPEWMKNLDSVIRFIVDNRGPISVAEFRDFLVAVWLPHLG